ncbi:MAG: delta-lactam-biosynthetic de-N-acetylase [Thermoanaerobacteraceae bacterium]|jgi:peptidoglycan-N-acetylmuramic acid deacetylase|nr:delta-lactam-biosynthetic de-N-acetylase [Thermoanaerobacteraceae bacterium]
MKKRLTVMAIITAIFFSLTSCGILKNKKPQVKAHEDLIQKNLLNKKNKDNSQTENNNEENKTVIDKNSFGTNTETNKAIVKTGGLDNTLYGWGLRRMPDHKTPEITSKAMELIKKYDGIFTGDTNKKVVYLTFDEGYENGYTPKILDILKENNVKAAFFVTGPYIKQHGDLVKRMVDEGHIVGNHTVNHPSLPSISDEKVKEEITKLGDMYKNLTGKQMHYFRPPKGEYSERTLYLTKSLGYKTVFWSLAFADWQPLPGGPDESYNTVMKNIHQGAVILLHAVSKDNTLALDRILKDVKAQGYEFKTLDDIK